MITLRYAADAAVFCRLPCRYAARFAYMLIADISLLYCCHAAR